VKFDSIVTLDIDNDYKDLPADTSAGIFTSGLLGENYIGLSPGGDPEVLKPGEEIAFTQPAVDLLQLVGKYMFSGGGKPAGSGEADSADAGADPSIPPAASPSPEEPVK
jgi:phospholipid/cholesterol/gamma-HCH transport system substrate-binding protein